MQDGLELRAEPCSRAYFSLNCYYEQHQQFYEMELHYYTNFEKTYI